MPNSTATPGHSTYLSALRQIDSIPVPDLASTLHLSSAALHNQPHRRHRDPGTNDNEVEGEEGTADESVDYSEGYDTDGAAAEANVSFLRTHLDPQEEWRAQNADAWEELQHRQRERERERTQRGWRDQQQQLQHLQRGSGQADVSSVASGGSSGGSTVAAVVRGQHGNGGEDRARRERLQRVLNRLNRIHASPSFGSLTSSPRGSGPPAAASAALDSAATRQMLQSARDTAYGAGVPQENSLYDWSPMGEAHRQQQQQQHAQYQGQTDADARQPQVEADDGNGQDDEVEDEMRAQRDVSRAAMLIYSQLRTDQPNTHPDVLRATARVRAREQIEAERDAARRRAYSSLLSRHDVGTSHAPLSEQPLRNQALLQSVRRHPRFSQRSREYMQRYVIDRERAQHEGEEPEWWRGQRERHAGNDSNLSRSPLRNTSSDNYDLSRTAWQNHSSTSVDSQNGSRSRTAYRRMYLENPVRTRHSDKTLEPSDGLQKTITYLAQLRDCVDYEAALSRAVDADLMTKEYVGEMQDDFLLEFSKVPPPQQTSWLAPGAVFSGSQHATSGCATRREIETPLASGSAVIPQHIWQNMTSSERRAQERREARRNAEALRADEASLAGIEPGARQHPQRMATAPDRWPVKVTIHAVDWDKMTVAATMEAYNVPHHGSSYSSIISAANASATLQDDPSADIDTDMLDADADAATTTTTATTRRQHPVIHPKSSSITTYLEGEIINFTQHTLLTESYPSDRRNDALYWRKLEPFSNLESDDDMTRLLVSKSALRDLNSRYVLMRWKERCFIPASASSTSANPTSTSPAVGRTAQVWDGGRPWMNQGDAVMAETGEGCGLTISGFYYVCLRREDGEVEGLYCDPESSPYQHLRLGRVGGGCFPTWSFA